MRKEELAGLVDEHRVQLGAQHARGRQSQLLTQVVEHRLESASPPDGHRVPQDLPGVADRGVGQGPRSLPVSREGPKAAQLAGLRRVIGNPTRPKLAASRPSRSAAASAVALKAGEANSRSSKRCQPLSGRECHVRVLRW